MIVSWSGNMFVVENANCLARIFAFRSFTRHRKRDLKQFARSASISVRRFFARLTHSEVTSTAFALAKGFDIKRGENEWAMHERDINRVRWRAEFLLSKLTDPVYISGLEATPRSPADSPDILYIQIYPVLPARNSKHQTALFHVLFPHGERIFGENARDNLVGAWDSLLLEYSDYCVLRDEQKRHTRISHVRSTHDRSCPTFPRKVKRIVRSSVLISRERSSHRGSLRNYKYRARSASDS